MRQRVTFIHDPQDAVDPASLNVGVSAVTGPVIKAAREDRVTLALEELPEELKQVLGSCHELHIRWASPNAYETVTPLLSRLSPGFHLFYTPHADGDMEETRLCNLLQKAFGPLDCSSPKSSFTALPHDRFSHSAAFQYYQPLESLAAFIKYASDDLCPASDPACGTRVQRLSEASSLDISYDTISHALKVTATWPSLEQPVMVTSQRNYRTEVGILAADKLPNMEPDELGLSGILTVLGQDTKPSQTMFAFASRHRRAEAAFSSRFLDPTGLHPTLQLQVSSTKPPSDDSYCSLHAYLTLPRTIFADRYQLSDPLFLASKNLTALHYITQPVDLEAPDYAMDLWGSAALLELAAPAPSEDAETGGGTWTAEVPLHLRYLAPSGTGYRDVEVPYPAVFWACTTEEGTKFPSNPFDRVNLGYDALFGPRTVFWHVDPRPEHGQRLMTEVKVPVLDLSKSAWVNVGTAAAVLLGFAWVAWKLLSVYLKTGYGSAPHTSPGEADAKKKQ
ncbi:Protein pbn1 [Pleurostoma richardsiae]|uniref:Protein PBN1 n=1 Tax=Pleurostoma richardsiae TaxID=41990 RepID=A0AA38S263_9PEZI|nr:Protein pbn1 [Pleurostoma richardsiae]